MSQTIQKIVFRLEQDKDGFPPVHSETIWANETPDGFFRLDGIPFFATEATLDDIVDVKHEGGELVFSRVVRESSNSLIRVFYFGNTDPQAIRDKMKILGCTTEWMEVYSLIAVNVPNGSALLDVQMVLKEGARQDKWDYEEPILRHPSHAA